MLRLTPTRAVNGLTTCRKISQDTDELVDVHLQDSLMLQQRAVGEQISQGSALASMLFVQGETNSHMSINLPHGAEKDRTLLHVQPAFLYQFNGNNQLCTQGNPHRDYLEWI